MDGGNRGSEGCFRSERNTLKSVNPLEQCCRYNGFVAVLVAFTLLLVMLVLL